MGSQSDLVLAIDLGGTHLRVAAIDRDGVIHHRVKHKTPHADTPDVIVRALVEAVRECARATVTRLSVAIPGTVNAREGTVLKTPNVPSLSGFRLAATLQDEFKSAVILENDANAAAFGEMWKGAARGHRAMICITLGTGVGGGIILNGKLWRGAHGAAAEVGHMAVVGFDGVECGCGSRGCLEVYASATAVVRMAREAKPRHPDSMLDTGENLTSEKVYLAAVNGDELSLDVFRQMGAYLGVGVANLINVIDPEVVVIGGGLSNGWDLFAEHVQREVSNRAFPVPARAVKILRAECGDDAGLLGAAYIAFNNPPHV